MEPYYIIKKVDGKFKLILNPKVHKPKKLNELIPSGVYSSGTS